MKKTVLSWIALGATPLLLVGALLLLRCAEMEVISHKPKEFWIAFQPQEQVVGRGLQALFVVQAAGGDSLGYQWLCDDSLISGATSYQYRIDAASVLDSNRTFSCLVFSGTDTVASEKALLTVIPRTVITTHPQSVLALSGENVGLSVEYVLNSGYYDEYKSSAWHVDGVPQVADNQATMSSTRTLGAVSAELDSSRYFYVVNFSRQVLSPQSGTYYTLHLSDTSETAVLRVLQPVSILRQSTQVTVLQGNSATFFVAATGPALSYQWYRNDTLLVDAVDSSYRIGAAVAADSGAQFHCVVTGTLKDFTGSIESYRSYLSATSTKAFLKVTAAGVVPSLVDTLSGRTAVQGKPIEFCVEAEGSWPLSYQWYRDTTALDGDTGSCLSISAPAIATHDSTYYNCIITNAEGACTTNALLLRVVAQGIAATVTVPRSQVSAYMSRPCTLSVEGAGTEPLSYQWVRYNYSSYTYDTLEGARSARYVIDTLKQADVSSSYYCLVWNEYNTQKVLSSSIQISSNSLPQAPTLYTNLAPLFLREGATVTLLMSSYSSAPMHFQWLRNGGIIAGATDSIYALGPVGMEEDGDTIRCRVGNIGGETLSNGAELSVVGALERSGAMVKIPAKGIYYQRGSNKVGSTASPEHTVALSYNYWMDTTEVTQAAYKLRMGANVNPSVFKNDLKPVEALTWYDALLYCNARSKAEGFDTVYVYDSIPHNQVAGNRCSVIHGLKFFPSRNGYRLPTEAEWEFACRATTITDYSWGEAADDATVSLYAWSAANSSNSTQLVAKKRENSYGLYDMHGNVWEWCHDAAVDYSSVEKHDPIDLEIADNFKVIRGGGYDVYTNSLPSYVRLNASPSLSGEVRSIGFRCVRGDAIGSIAPQMLSQRGDTLVALGGRVELRVEAVGSEPMRYRWLRNDTLQPQFTGPDLVLAHAALGDNGSYVCEISNATSVTAISAPLVVMVADTLRDTTLVAGSALNLATGVVVPQGENVSFAWYKNDVLEPN